MTQAQIDKAIAKGVRERREKHLAKMNAEQKKFETRIDCCNTTKSLDDLKESISNLNTEQHKQHSKNIEYKNYEDAGFNDDYQDMYDKFDTKLYKKRQELKL